MRHYIEIFPEVCKGCQLCIPECPKGVIELGKHFNSKGWQFAVPEKNELCIGCKKCATVCPDLAIRVYQED